MALRVPARERVEGGTPSSAACLKAQVDAHSPKSTVPKDQSKGKKLDRVKGIKIYIPMGTNSSCNGLPANGSFLYNKTNLNLFISNKPLVK